MELLKLVRRRLGCTLVVAYGVALKVLNLRCGPYGVAFAALAALRMRCRACEVVRCRVQL